jgi:hypothetical protein
MLKRQYLDLFLEKLPVSRLKRQYLDLCLRESYQDLGEKDSTWIFVKVKASWIQVKEAMPGSLLKRKLH